MHEFVSIVYFAAVSFLFFASHSFEMIVCRCIQSIQLNTYETVEFVENDHKNIVEKNSRKAKKKLFMTTTHDWSVYICIFGISWLMDTKRKDPKHRKKYHNNNWSNHEKRSHTHIHNVNMNKCTEKLINCFCSSHSDQMFNESERERERETGRSAVAWHGVAKRGEKKRAAFKTINASNRINLWNKKHCVGYREHRNQPMKWGRENEWLKKKKTHRKNKTSPRVNTKNTLILIEILKYIFILQVIVRISGPWKHTSTKKRIQREREKERARARDQPTGGHKHTHESVRSRKTQAYIIKQRLISRNVNKVREHNV